MARLPTPSAHPSRPPPSSATATTNKPAPSDFKTYHRRRSGVWAIGIAVITSVGAILGAQIKTAVQARESARAELLAVESGKGKEKEGGELGLVKEGVVGVAEAGKAVIGKVEQQEKAAKSEDETKADLRDLERSIATLESRRGQLVSRRLLEEGRLAGLRERMMAKQKQANADRTGQADVQVEDEGGKARAGVGEGG